MENLISQIVISNKTDKNLISQNATSSHGGLRKLPFVFTEQGVAMLSSVLKSDTAIEVNIKIIRIFNKMRELLFTNKDILLKLEQLENKILRQSEDISKHDNEMQMVFAALKQLLVQEHEPRNPIGFKIQTK